jgi:hypothetical protein
MAMKVVAGNKCKIVTHLASLYLSARSWNTVIWQIWGVKIIPDMMFLNDRYARKIPIVSVQLSPIQPYPVALTMGTQCLKSYRPLDVNRDKCPKPQRPLLHAVQWNHQDSCLVYSLHNLSKYLSIWPDACFYLGHLYIRLFTRVCSSTESFQAKMHEVCSSDPRSEWILYSFIN